MKKAIEVHITGKVNQIYKGDWECTYVSSRDEEKKIAIYPNGEIKKMQILPVQTKLIKAVAKILFEFSDMNDNFEYSCPYICEFHINDDGTCKYRTLGANVAPWKEIHHKEDNTITAFVKYENDAPLEFWQIQNQLLQPHSVDRILFLLKQCGATQIDTEYITKQPSGIAHIYTRNAGDGMNIIIGWD